MFNKKAWSKEYYKIHREEKKVYDKEYSKTHKEKNKVKCKKYYKTHKEGGKARCKEYNKTHKEEIKTQRKDYRRTHKEEIKTQRKEYNKTHKEVNNAGNRRFNKTLKGRISRIKKHIYRRKSLILTPTFLRISSNDIKELLQKAISCPHCKKVFCEHLFMKKSLDHIIPVSRGGLDTKSNCQILCLACNKKKHNKLESEVK